MFLFAILILTSSNRIKIFKADKKNTDVNSQFVYLQSSKYNKKHAINMSNYQDIFHYAEIEIGTPKQKFKVIVDTGSADIWVRSDKMSITSGNSYKSKLSSTYKYASMPFSIKYDEGYAKGVLCSDDLFIGDIKITDQVFGEVSEYSPTDLPYEGFLGLGQQISSDSGALQPVQNMFKQGSIKKEIIGIYLSDTSDSEITFGYLDHSHYKGIIKYVPVISDEYWIFLVNKLQFGDIELNYIQAMADIGSDGIYGPHDTVMKIYKALRVFNWDGLDLTYCFYNSIFPELVLEIDGAKFVLKHEDYLAKLHEGSILCKPLIRTKKDLNVPIWILGDTFLKKFYSVYNYENRLIGFAHSNIKKPNSLIILVILTAIFS